MIFCSMVDLVGKRNNELQEKLNATLTKLNMTSWLGKLNKGMYLK